MVFLGFVGLEGIRIISISRCEIWTESIEMTGLKGLKGLECGARGRARCIVTVIVYDIGIVLVFSFPVSSITICVIEIGVD